MTQSSNNYAIVNTCEAQDRCPHHSPLQESESETNFTLNLNWHEGGQNNDNENRHSGGEPQYRKTWKSLWQQSGDAASFWHVMPQNNGKFHGESFRERSSQMVEIERLHNWNSLIVSGILCYYELGWKNWNLPPQLLLPLHVSKISTPGTPQLLSHNEELLLWLKG